MRQEQTCPVSIGAAAPHPGSRPAPPPDGSRRGGLRGGLLGDREGRQAFLRAPHGVLAFGNFCGRPTVCSHLEIDSKGHFTVSTLSSEKKQYVGKGSGASVTPCRRGGWDPLVPTDTRRWPELARGTGPKSAITMLGFDRCDGIGLGCKWGVQSKNIM